MGRKKGKKIDTHDVKRKKKKKKRVKKTNIAEHAPIFLHLCPNLANFTQRFSEANF